MLPRTSTRMARKRLRRLVSILENVKSENFTMDVWEAEVTKECPATEWETTGAEKCGTVCCAAGWAMHDPWMNKQGLTRVVDDGIAYPCYNGVSGYSAISEFFSLCNTTVLHVFDPDGYKNVDCGPTISEVIKRINAVLASRKLDYVPRLW